VRRGSAWPAWLVLLFATNCGPTAEQNAEVTSDAGDAGDAGRSCPREIVRQGSTGMVIVPAGEFVMGCDEKLDPRCDFDELPVRRVTLSAFEIDRTEVVESDYATCVAAGVCRSVELAKPPSAQLPVLGVSWEDADTYCRFANKRLPTEAEWEKAARGSTTCRFPWGDREPDCAHANYLDCGSKPRAVGTADSASPYGVLDLAGNACEWVADWYEGGYSGPLEVRDPIGAPPGTYRVVRGGAYFSGSDSLRVTERDFSDPQVGRPYLGFRCARTL
jgi:formylglycine-generating enzyme required for sulfatase activity